MATRMAIARLSKARQNLNKIKAKEEHEGEDSKGRNYFKPSNGIDKKTTKRNFIEEKWKSIVEAERLRHKAEPQFHLQPLGKNTDPNVVQIRVLGCLGTHAHLVKLRLLLFFLNLAILATAVMSFQAWIKIDEIKHQAQSGLPQVDKDRDPFDVPHPWLHDHHHMLAHGFAHANQILFSSGVMLICYYLVYGFLVPIKYGNFTVMAFSVYGGPPIIVVIVGYFFTIAWSLLQVTHELNIMNCKEVSGHVTYMRMAAMIDCKHYFNQAMPTLSYAMIISGLVMAFQNLLPFFMYDMPFQRKLDVDDFVLSYNTKMRAKQKVIWYNRDEYHLDLVPYRELSAAFTLMLQLCKPELRNLHRSK